MSTLKEDLTAIKEIQDGLVNNKVARFSYTHKAYTDNTVDGVNEYNVNNEQNIPNGTASIMKVNSTVLDKGYRAQASSITRMLMNHFLGRISYNLNKINDNMQSLLNTLITKFPTSLPANGGNADTATRLQTARTINIQDSTATNTGTGASFDGSGNATIKLPATIKADIIGHATNADTATNAYTAINADTATNATSANTANKVRNSLTFGSKTYNGSSAQEITADDLGIPAVSFSKCCPKLSQLRAEYLPFTIPADGWILNISSIYDIKITIKIDDFTDNIEVLPQQKYLGQFHDTKSNTDKKVVVPLNCPFPVKKGQVIDVSVDTEAESKAMVTFAPCFFNYT